MSNLVSDLRYALRTLRRSPLFAGIAILSLALGIGANTAIFTLMDQLLLRLLPVKDPSSIVMLYQRGAHNGSNMGTRMHSYPIYRDFQQRAEAFSEVFCRREVETSLTVESRTERVDTELVSGNYFTALGVKPEVGRVFNSAEDDRQYRGHPVVVLSYDYWATRFAGDRNIVGKKILVNNYPMTVVGVSAKGFTGLDPVRSPQIRIPILMKPVIMPSQDWIEIDNRRARWVQVFARLKPGHTPESAQSALQVLFTQIRRYEMALPTAKDWSAYSRDQFMKGTVHVEKADVGFSMVRNRFSTALMVLMCMVGLVLLIACANVANLLIARAVARQKEIAVRLSIGASRAQLVRQFLVESLTLSTFGGVLGIFLAIWLTRALLAFFPVEGNPLLLRAEPDLRILAFTIGLTILTAVVFGMAPALKASRPDLWSTLKDSVGAIAGTSGAVSFRKGLVAAQVALSFLLLFGAGLFVRSLQNLQTMKTGFNEIENLITFQLSPALNGYTPERVVQFYDTLLSNIRSTPGVKSAGFAAVPLLHGYEWDNSVRVEGYTSSDAEDMQAFMNGLSPGYFAAMGITLLEGRDFERRDMVKDSKVCIVNKKFAEHYFKGRSPIGRHIGQRGDQAPIDTEIIGVVDDALYEGPREGVRRQVFVPQWGNNSTAFYVRTSQNPDSMYGALRAQVANLDSSLPIYELKTLQSQLNETLLTERLIAMLSAGFGALATLLASIGLYGVMAFVVARRTKEIGVRMALGAQPSTVLWLVMREVLMLFAIGLAIGVPVAFGLGRYLANQLYGIPTHDPWSAGTAVLLLGLVCLLAGLVPARSAARMDPLVALRYE